MNKCGSERDVLVIGSGAAGLCAAVSAAQAGGRVAVMSFGTAASGRASGFNGAMGQNDGPATFCADMLRSGASINDPVLAARISAFAGNITSLFENYGIDLEKAGALKTRLSGGSSVPRTIYTAGEHLGAWILEQLAETARKLGVEFVDGRAFDIVRREKLFLAFGLTEKGEIRRCVSGAVVIATGGLGRLYGYTTNYPSSNGMGYMLALNLGATLIDMEFAQFEPFIMLGPGPCRGRGVPINLVADGGRITNSLGNEFIPQSSLGIRAYTKDILCRLISTEVWEGRGSANGGVHCDLSAAERIIDRYPGFLKSCESAGMNPLKVKIDICPAYHCMMGGILIDANANVGVEGLYAAGEVAGGVHGANRLGSNGITDALCFGSTAGQNAAAYALKNARAGNRQKKDEDSFESTGCQTKGMDSKEVYDIVGQTMSKCAGLTRTEQSLSAAAARIEAIANRMNRSFGERKADHDVHDVELMNTLDLARIVISMAIRRRETRGVHYRMDFPKRDDQYNGSFTVRRVGNDLQYDFLSRDPGASGCHPG